MYICGGSFGSFGSAVDEKNEECIVLALSVECIYVVAFGSFGSAVVEKNEE